MDLKDKFVDIIRQGWIPIFVDDGRKVEDLAAACAQAGVHVIEITCRRKNVLEEISYIRETYPDWIILAGSTIDNEGMRRFYNKRLDDPCDAVPSFSELAEAGADGFVSIFPFSEETIQKYRHSHILIPCCTGIPDAFHMMGVGAHFIKLVSILPEQLKLYTSAPTYKLIPFMVTGGVTVDKIDQYVENGVSILAGGWDIIASMEDNTVDALSARLEVFTKEMCEARNRHDCAYSSIEELPWYNCL